MHISLNLTRLHGRKSPATIRHQETPQPLEYHFVTYHRK